MKNKEERHAWLLKRLDSERMLNVLDQKLVDDFIAFTECPYKPTAWGAHVCPTLSHDLKQMYDKGVFARFRVGLGCNWQLGFPRWVWCYERAAS